MTRGLGGSLLPYRVRDFHSLFLASFPGAQPDPDVLIKKEAEIFQKEQDTAMDSKIDPWDALDLE